MKTKKFNILDAIIALFIIALLFVVGFRFVTGKNIAQHSSYSNATMVVKASSLRDFTADEIKKDAQICISDKTDMIGTIKEVKIEDSKVDARNLSGVTTKVAFPEHYDVYVTIEIQGIQKDYGFYWNGKTPVAVNSDMVFKTGHVLFSGQIVEINS